MRAELSPEQIERVADMFHQDALATLRYLRQPEAWESGLEAVTRVPTSIELARAAAVPIPGDADDLMLVTVWERPTLDSGWVAFRHYWQVMFRGEVHEVCYRPVAETGLGGPGEWRIK